MWRGVVRNDFILKLWSITMLTGRTKVTCIEDNGNNTLLSMFIKPFSGKISDIWAIGSNQFGIIVIFLNRWFQLVPKADHGSPADGSAWTNSPQVNGLDSLKLSPSIPALTDSRITVSSKLLPPPVTSCTKWTMTTWLLMQWSYCCQRYHRYNRRASINVDLETMC